MFSDYKTNTCSLEQSKLHHRKNLTYFDHLWIINIKILLHIFLEYVCIYIMYKHTHYKIITKSFIKNVHNYILI